jgi:beta-fructofuranosidase
MDRADLHRPQYHFLPPANWMNDPNGLIQWKGQYHLFYQYNPDGPCWGRMHWGHAVSGDLVHWTDLPLALAPTPGGPDGDGCWSGCAVDDDGVPTLIYTGVYPERPCVATSADDLYTWDKYAGNPVIVSPPEGLDVVGFRDHSVWREGHTWYQVIGSGIRDIGGTALLYQSPDLINWEYIRPILVGDKDQADPLPTGTMWECPDFFPLGDKHVLLVSAHGDGPLYTAYFIGTYEGHEFTPEILSKLDWGDIHFYAPQTMFDDQGRRIMFGWIQEGRTGEAQRAAGWSGVMSLPRILSVRPDGLLGVEPAPELELLRGRHCRYTGVTLTPSSSGLLEDVWGDCLEIVAEFDPGGGAEQFGLKLRCSPDDAPSECRLCRNGGSEQTSVLYDRIAGHLVIDRRRSSLSLDAQRHVQEGVLNLAAGEGLRLHVFLDRSVVEIYANGRLCLTSRIYPSRTDSQGIGLFARGGSVWLRSLDVWEVNSIWVGRGPGSL